MNFLMCLVSAHIPFQQQINCQNSKYEREKHGPDLGAGVEQYLTTAMKAWFILKK